MIASLPATCSQSVRTIDILLISMGFVLTVTLQMSAWYTACQEFEIYFWACQIDSRLYFANVKGSGSDIFGQMHTFGIGILVIVVSFV